MNVDEPTPLTSAASFKGSAFEDLTRNFSEDAIDEILIEATRACETEVGRRLVPFTLTETHRAEGIDPDELGAIGSGLQLDLQGSLGASYAAALGSGIGALVRKVWLRQHATHFPEMWAYSDVTCTVTLSFGGAQTVAPMAGPTNDTGLLWFNVGTFCPIGSLVQVTYSGGYQTIPADLRRAAKYMAAAIFCRELDPERSSNHDAGSLEALAVSWLEPYRGL
ncbi:hypothetical protein [Pseudonocardia sp. T1-2H]|uniref:hypothetical protein n=1 Tax=Pseudonocardia sp. T1-2H TaxID=3128899 RepID=UPI0031018649